jgi:hypothetical protein
LSLAQIIEFFEMIEFNPGHGCTIYGRGHQIGCSTKLLNTLLVAMTLGLEDLVDDMWTLLAARNDVVVIPYESICDLVRHRSAYPSKFVYNLLLFLATMCGVVSGNVTDDLIDLSTDANFGIKYYARLAIVTEMACITRKNLGSPGDVEPRNVRGEVGDAGDPKSSTTPNPTRRWNNSVTEYFNYCCPEGCSSSSMVEVDTGIVQGNVIDDFSFLVEGDTEDVFVLRVPEGRDLSPILGHVQKDQAIILQGLWLKDHPNLKVLGRIVDCTPTAVTIARTSDISLTPSQPACILHIRNGIHTGFYYGYQDEDVDAPKCHFLDDSVQDAFFRSANFVIRIPIISPEGQVCGWHAFLVHDWVMYRRWSYFRRVIDSGLDEAKTSILTLPSDFPHALLGSLIFYLYTARNSSLYDLDKSAAQDAFVDEYASMYGFGEDELADFLPKRVMLTPYDGMCVSAGHVDFSRATVVGLFGRAWNIGVDQVD